MSLYRSGLSPEWNQPAVPESVLGGRLVTVAADHHGRGPLHRLGGDAGLAARSGRAVSVASSARTMADDPAHSAGYAFRRDYLGDVPGVRAPAEHQRATMQDTSK